jgi:cytochrome P450
MLDGVRHNVSMRLVRRMMKQSDPDRYLYRLSMDPAVAANPFPLYDELRARGPVVATKAAAFVTGYDAAQALYRDNRLGHGTPPTRRPLMQRLIFPDHYADLVHPLEPPSMISVDPPAHTRYRKLVARAFSVKKIEALAPRVAELADGLLEDLLRDPQADVMTGYAAQLPVLVIADMLGVPLSDQALFKTWGYDVARTLDGTMTWTEVKAAKTSLAALNAYFDEAFAQRRAEPRPDLLTALVQAEVDGETLSRDELLTTALLLLVAGFETTVNLLGNAITTCAPTRRCSTPPRTPTTPGGTGSSRRRCASTPRPVHRRIVLEPLTHDGVQLEVGKQVVLLIGAANRDPPSSRTRPLPPGPAAAAAPGLRQRHPLLPRERRWPGSRAGSGCSGCSARPAPAARHLRSAGPPRCCAATARCRRCSTRCVPRAPVRQRLRRSPW